jgi:hypothetical protein
MLVCDVCGSRDIMQEATIMMNPNDEDAMLGPVYNDFMWHDYYWCNVCDDQNHPIEDPHRTVINVKEKK